MDNIELDQQIIDGLYQAYLKDGLWEEFEEAFLVMLPILRSDFCDPDIYDLPTVTKTKILIEAIEEKFIKF